MSTTRRTFLAPTAAAALAATGSLLAGCPRRESGVRIGFILKQPEEQWFQSEWHFAGLAARDRGFELIRIGAADGERVLTAIDDLYAKYAQGFVICAPDPNLGARRNSARHRHFRPPAPIWPGASTTAWFPLHQSTMKLRL